MKIIFPDPIYLKKNHLSQLKELGEFFMYNNVPTNETETIKRITETEIIIPSRVSITKNIIVNSPSLKYIIVPSVGYEWIDTQHATKKGIKVLNSPTYNSYAVAERTLALLFAIARKIPEANNNLKNGEWNRFKYKGTELKNKKLGIIGHGKIGKKIEGLAKAIGIHVSYTNSKTPSNELDHLLKTADIISINLPLTEKTKHLINEEKLLLMKKNAYIINTSRGFLIDQKALLKVLNRGHLAGVALDVFEDEPLVGTPSKEILDLVRHPRVVATPHIGFSTQEAFLRLGEELISNVKSCIKNTPINTVN